MRLPLVTALLLLFFVALPAGSAPVRGAVATDHVLASQAGAEILQKGGNAADAAVAAALVIGVVQPAGSGLGGGGFAMVAKEGKAWALDFRETAPAAATREMFLKEGTSSTKGGLAVAIPAEAFGLVELQHRYGKLEWAEVVLPAIQFAKNGFNPGKHLLDGLIKFPAMTALFSEDHKRIPLKNTLVGLATSHGSLFREGWIANDIVDSVRAVGGILTTPDLKNYKVEERTPLMGSYEGYTVATMPSPSSGGTALLEMLGATEGVDNVLCEVEAAKHAMARRALTGGDQPASKGPVVDPARIAAIRADCGEKTYGPEHYGALVTPLNDHGTTHISVLDGNGLAVAITSTINTPFGSEVVTKRGGILLNNEMDDFTTQPGKPNAFGLVQSEANAVGPGKRPLSSMTPTILMDSSGKPVLVVGASGGPFIITATYQVIRNVLDHHLSAAAAVAAPRWHHQWQPNLVTVDASTPEATRQLLLQAGHEIKATEGFSASQVVTFLNGQFDAGADPRKGGEPVILQ